MRKQTIFKRIRIPLYFILIIACGVVFSSGCAAVRNQSKRQELSYQHFIAGQAFMEENNHMAALRQFKKSDSYEPDNPAILYAISNAYFHLGRINDASSYLKKTIKYAPTNPQYLIRAGEFYLHQNNTDLAKEMFKRAVESEPDDYRANYGLGMIAFHSKDFTTAETLFRKLISLDPQNEEGYLFLGNLLVSNKQYDEAIKVFESILQLRVGHIESLYSLGMIYQIKNDSAKAEEYFLEVTKYAPHFVPAYEMLANMAISQQDFKKAEIYYRKVFETMPDSPSAKNNLAWVYLEQNKNIDEAIRLATESVDEQQNADNLDTLGWAYFLKGDYHKAQVNLEKASAEAKKDKNNLTLSVVRLHQAHLMEKKGNPTVALEYLKEAVKLDPTNEEASSYLKKWQQEYPLP